MVPVPHETPRTPYPIRENPRFADDENHLMSRLILEVTGAES